MKSRTKIPLLFFVLVMAISPCFVFAQAEKKGDTLRVEGEVAKPLTLTPGDVDKLPKTSIKLKERNGKEYLFTGVALGLVLKNAGVSLGTELKGENLSKYLLVEASDGYQVVFSLAEVDPAFTSRKIILANRKDGVLLSSDEGPFRIIIDGEKRLPRNARQVILMKINYAN